MVTAGRSIAAARCSTPTRSASSTSPTGCRSTPRKPTTRASSPRHCSSASPPKARRSHRWRNRRRLDASSHRVATCFPPPQGGREKRASMTHPGEQFYPEGVRWDDAIARGTLPDLLSTAAAKYAARPAIEFRDRAIGYSELAALVETAAAALLRAGYGRDTSVALFL